MSDNINLVVIAARRKTEDCFLLIMAPKKGNLFANLLHKIQK